MKIVTVINKYELFDKVIKSNEHHKDCEIHYFDNSAKNVSITKHYNEFIEDIGDDEDFWIAFIHQDFGFLENPNKIVETLNPQHIYGAIGARFYNFIHFNKHGFKRHYVVNYGQILQGNNNFDFTTYGTPLKRPKNIDAVDCCCIIIHSSLIKKYNLRFDENLNFHMYAEDLCYRAKHEHNIKIKAVQINCFHMGKGTLNEEFERSASYLKTKFHIKRIPSTCPN